MDANSTRIAVTGAGGLIGTATIRALVAAGADVRALLGPGDPEAGWDDVATSRADINDGAAVHALCSGVDTVVHLAGPPSVAASFADPALYARIHTAGTATVLSACVRAGVQRVVYVSSAEVYGRAGAQPVAEDTAIDPRSPYAAAKAGAEAMVRAFGHAHGLTTWILRPFSVYGAGFAERSLLGAIVRQSATDAVELFDLAPVRDYCHVSDVADAIVRACTHAEHASATLNVGTGVGTSVADLARLVVSVLDRSTPVRQAPGRQRPGASEIYCLIADPRRARRILGWRPQLDLEQGLRLTLGRSGAHS